MGNFVHSSMTITKFAQSITMFPKFKEQNVFELNYFLYHLNVIKAKVPN
jgi:hypothetical protein